MLAAARDARLARPVSGGRRRTMNQISSPSAVATILTNDACVLTPSWRIATMPMMSAGSGAQAINPAQSVPRREGIYVGEYTQTIS